jgi:hypothetical protein
MASGSDGPDLPAQAGLSDPSDPPDRQDLLANAAAAKVSAEL